MNYGQQPPWRACVDSNMRIRFVTLLAGLLSACSPTAILNATVPSQSVVQRDIPYGIGPRRTLDVYRPTTPGASPPLVVFLYGGSWTGGSKSMYPFVAEPLAGRGAVVVVPDYRVYPEVTYPDFLRDNAAAVAWAVQHAPEYGATGGVFVMGHSAGAYNAAMLALDPEWLREAGIDRRQLAGVIGISTPADFLPSHDPDVIPVFGPANTPANQPLAFADGTNPPLLLLHGDEDTTVKPRNTTTLAAAIRRRGGAVETRIYPGVAHIGIILAFAPLFRGNAPVLDDVWAFIQANRQTPAANSPTTQITPPNQATERNVARSAM